MVLNLSSAEVEAEYNPWGRPGAGAPPAEENKPEVNKEPERQQKQEAKDRQSVQRQSEGRRRKTSNERETLSSAERHMRLNTAERKKTDGIIEHRYQSMQNPRGLVLPGVYKCVCVVTSYIAVKVASFFPMTT